MINKSKSAHLGFTLIEILIALFIFAIISLITSVTLHSIFTTHEQLTRHADQLQELQLTSLMLENDLSQIVNRPIITAAGNLAPALIGEYTSLEFTRAGNNKPLIITSSMIRVSYYLRNHQLIRATWNNLDQLTTDKPREKVLLTNVQTLEFGYLGNNSGFSENWFIATNNPTSLVFPRAIQVKISLEKLGDLTLLIPLPNATNLGIILSS